MTWLYYFVLSLIVVLTLLGNSLVIYVLLAKRKTFLSRPYGIFILNLAIVDFLTAIFLIFSRLVNLPMPTYSEIAAKIFCATVRRQTAFLLGGISIFTCVSLTIERWIAVVKPSAYRSLKPKHAVVTVVVVWVSGIAVNASTFLRKKYLPTKRVCKWVPYPFAKEEFPWIDLTVQTIIPDITMVVLYAHIYFRLKNLPQTSSNSTSQMKKITVVALLACSALILGWLPARITFTLSKYGHKYRNLHQSFVLLAFSNSCVNPWLYGMCSAVFRAEYKIVLKKALKLCTALCRFPFANFGITHDDPVKTVSVMSLQPQPVHSSVPRREIHEQNVS